MAAPDTVPANNVTAYRLHAHHLTKRQPADGHLDVAAACAIQNSPPGSALLALNARAHDVTPERLEQLTDNDKTLIQTWCMRGAPYFFPTRDAAIFTTGVLPATPTARLHLINGIDQALDELHLDLDEAVDHTAAEITDVLTGRQLAINELGAQTAQAITPRLTPAQRKTWQATGPYGTRQPLGEAVVHFCLRILTLRGLVCFAPRTGDKAPFVLVDEWLDTPWPQPDPETARANLLRRYLHCYGPSTRKDFATWIGVNTKDTDAWWTTLQDQLTPVTTNGTKTWIHTDDLDTLKTPPRTHGVRLLPPGDPYTQMRDRDTIVDKKHHRDVWKTIGAPGTVLADGTIAATWRPRKNSSTLTLTITPIHTLNKTHRNQLHDEAEHVAALRGASKVRVEFTDET